MARDRCVIVREGASSFIRKGNIPLSVSFSKNNFTNVRSASTVKPRIHGYCQFTEM